jgi:hypothetical protein
MRKELYRLSALKSGPIPLLCRYFLRRSGVPFPARRLAASIEENPYSRVAALFSSFTGRRSRLGHSGHARRSKRARRAYPPLLTPVAAFKPRGT